MKLSLNWLSDYVDLKSIDHNQIVYKLNKCCCEAEYLEETGSHLRNVFSSKIVDITPHPNADRLSLVTIEYNKQNEIVVCGAKNIDIGKKVAYAGIGCILPGGFKIKKAKIRGVESNGMLCSESELGFSDEHQGILILADDCEIGVNLAKIYPDQLDHILEIDNQSITHRPDLWGHFGIARELAVIFDLAAPTFDNKAIDIFPNTNPSIKINVIDKKLVPRLSCQGIKNVKVLPSPDKIKHRLFRVGLRAINNIVDVSNYVMLDLGQPMHIFDLGKIKNNKLDIKLARKKDKFISLYNKELILTENDLVFYDNDKVVSISGVIGGLDSGVSDTTSNILMEAGNWDSLNLRKTANYYNLKTDAVQRYEKSIDPNLTIIALKNAYQLLKLSCNKIEFDGGIFDQFNKKLEEKNIEYDYKTTNRLLGLEIPKEEQKNILLKLGFKVKENTNKNWVVHVPSWRATKDINISVDLLEEIGRIHGYEKIVEKSPITPLDKPRFNQKRLKERKTKQFLVDRGYHEVYNSPFSNLIKEVKFNFSQNEVIKLINPSMIDQNTLNTSLLPGFIEIIQEIQKEHNEYKFFELSKVYYCKDKKYLEKQILISCLQINGSIENKLQTAIKDVKALTNLLEYGFWKHDFDNNPNKFQHPKLSVEVFCKDVRIGKIFRFHPEIEQKYKILNEPIIVEIDFDNWVKNQHDKIFYKKQSKYPSVYFDISIVVSNQTYFKYIQSIIFKISKDIFDVHFKDRYPIPKSDKISLTVTIIFRSENKTFSTDEITNLQNLVISKLAAQDIHLKK